MNDDDGDDDGDDDDDFLPNLRSKEVTKKDNHKNGQRGKLVS
jgi:hypothetical protein